MIAGGKFASREGVFIHERQTFTSAHGGKFSEPEAQQDALFTQALTCHSPFFFSAARIRPRVS
jgi:hypothetical protein